MQTTKIFNTKAVTSPRRRIRHALTFALQTLLITSISIGISTKNKLRREWGVKNTKYNTSTIIRTAKSGFLYARPTYNLAWRETITHARRLRSCCALRLPVPTGIKYERGPREICIFPVQLTTGRIGNLTRLIHTLAKCLTYTYNIWHIIHICTQNSRQAASRE